jgi:hypothetical protein
MPPCARLKCLTHIFADAHQLHGCAFCSSLDRQRTIRLASFFVLPFLHLNHARHLDLRRSFEGPRMAGAQIVSQSAALHRRRGSVEHNGKRRLAVSRQTGMSDDTIVHSLKRDIKDKLTGRSHAGDLALASSRLLYNNLSMLFLRFYSLSAKRFISENQLYRVCNSQLMKNFSTSG